MEQKRDWMAGPTGRLVTGALLFVLLSEWLRPLSAMQELTGITRVEPLILVLGGLIGVDVLRLPAVLAWLCKTVLILSLPAVFYGGASLFDGGWWSEFLETLVKDAGLIVRGEWHFISPELRTLLFVYAWAIVASCLFSAVLFKRFILWFSGATAVYLLMVDWWVGPDAFPALLRVALSGVVLHALYVPQVLQRQYGFARLASDRPMGWLFASLSLAALLLSTSAVSAAWMDARIGPAVSLRAMSGLPWPAWSKTAVSFPAMAVPAASGYGEDDALLGRPIALDHDPAFLAVTPGEPGYWRGEAKIVYTGSGWVRPDRPSAVHLALDGTNRPGGESNPAAGSRTATGGAEDELPESGWHLIYVLNDSFTRLERWPLFTPGYPERVVLLADRPERTGDGGASRDLETWLTWDPAAGSARLVRPPEGTTGFLAMYAAGGPSMPAHGGHGSGSDVGAGSGMPETPAGEAAYLQLPDSLPGRVRELAASITAPYSDPYDKALAIERYLREHYTYSLDPEEPGEGRDFADHFLFEAQTGYCDHFSTAMAVLLRAAGIPARWVKGFAPGEEVDGDEVPALLDAAGLTPDAATIRMLEAAAEAGFTIPAGADADWSYTLIRNSDAHSWVEAYLPGIGWVAFEPTPGFSGDGSEFGGPAREVTLQADGLSGGWLENGKRIAGRLAEHLTLFPAGRDSSWLESIPLVILTAAKLAALLWWLRRKKRLLSSVPAASLARPPLAARASVSIRLMLYGIGIGRHREGAKLLERMLECHLAPFRESRGDTLREAAGRAAALETEADSPLWRAVRLYEQAMYGAPRKQRMPARELMKVWRSLLRHVPAHAKKG